MGVCSAFNYDFGLGTGTHMYISLSWEEHKMITVSYGLSRERK